LKLELLSELCGSCELCANDFVFRAKLAKFRKAR